MRASISLLIFGVTTLLFGQGTREVPDAVFYNGKVITVDSSNSIKEAFAVKGDKFLAVGTTREMRALAGSQTRLVDLKGKAVMPGLMDNHNHAYHAAMANRGIDLKEAPSLAAMLDGVRKDAASAGPRTWSSRWSAAALSGHAAAMRDCCPDRVPDAVDPIQPSIGRNPSAFQVALGRPVKIMIGGNRLAG